VGGGEAISWFFGGLRPDHFDMHDNGDQPLFASALKKLGRLKSEEMYGFVPAVALSGSQSLDKLQKVKAIEQLVILAQLTDLQVVRSPFE
jgi:hypothetical protein